jgi:hypothetical protein
LSSSGFWLGDGKNKFTVNVSEPNGLADEYHDNDIYTTNFNMPDLYNDRIVLQYKTNERPENFTYKIFDMAGNEVFSKSGLARSKLYVDTLDVPDGCYSLQLTDAQQYGLSYWAYTEQGNGSFKISSLYGSVLKSFNPDFGVGIFYSFSLGDAFYVKDRGLDNLISVFPNPSEKDITVFVDYNIGNANLEIFDFNGKEILKDKVFIGDKFQKKYSTDNLSNGTYFVHIYNDNINITNKFIKR